jgi:hypothetical protein
MKNWKFLTKHNRNKMNTVHFTQAGNTRADSPFDEKFVDISLDNVTAPISHEERPNTLDAAAAKTHDYAVRNTGTNIQTPVISITAVTLDMVKIN